MVSENLSSKTICVIGAGPSGLVSARELRKEGHSVSVLEQNHDIGGQWLYQPEVEDEDPMGKKTPLKVHSSVYSSLRLASPRETMGFTDFPFTVKKGRDMRRYPSHDEMFLYLHDFCNWFKLREMIRFNTRVEYVGIAEDCEFEFGERLRWKVRSTEMENGVVIEEIFDAVVVANGHYSVPRLPVIRGMDEWRRRQLHSHVYRVPQSFSNEIVVVVGNSMSGQDISMELVNVAKEVHLSAKSLDISQGLCKVITKYQNLHLKPQIDTLYEDGRVLFVDGTFIIADTIIYCTGYSYYLEFLDTKGVVDVDCNRVGPLYEHTFPPSLAPSLSFVGIPKKVICFPFFESQAKWIAQVLSGRRTLPSFEEMKKEINEYYHSRDMEGIPKHNAHDIGSFEYCDKYGDKCNFPHLEEWRKELCLSTLLNANVNLETYRDAWDDDLQLLQEAHQSFYFTQLDYENIVL